MSRRSWTRALQSFFKVATEKSRRQRSGYCPTIERLEERSLLNAGDVDPTFGTAGKVLTSFRGSYNEQDAVAVRQADGKLILAGVSFNGYAGQVALARYNLDGGLDSSFGTGGRVRTNVAAADLRSVASVVVQSDDKIVVTGYLSQLGPSFKGDFALFRFNPDGSPDTMFGTGGQMFTDFGGQDTPTSSFVLANGKLLVVGGTRALLSGRSMQADLLARYDSDGSLDSTFGNGGKVIEPFVTGTAYFGRAPLSTVAMQPDGKLLIAETYNPGSPDSFEADFSLRRLNPDGSPDTGFGTQGFVVTPIGTNTADAVYGIVLQADGKVIVGGTSQSFTVGGLPAVALARYNSDGSLDPTFGTNGLSVTPIPNLANFLLRSLASEGASILLSGQAGQALAVLRFNSNGTVDTTFGNGGRLSAVFGLGAATATQITMAATQGYAVGWTTTDTNDDFALLRFNADGTVDSTFGSGGEVTTDFTGPVQASITEAVRQADGKLLVLGDVADGHGVVALARYQANGQPDTTFGAGGQVVTRLPLGPQASVTNLARALAVQSDGKILIAADDSVKAMLGRYLPNGQLDSTFGNNGILQLSVSNHSATTDLVVQPDGKIWVGGTHFVPQPGGAYKSANYVVRLNSNGSTDLGPIDVQSSQGTTRLLLQPNGGLIVTGSLHDATRLLPDGQRDPFFNFDAGALGRAALQSDGGIVAISPASVYSSFPLSLTRLLPDSGQLEPSFGFGGRTETNIRTDFPFYGPGDVLVQPNGVIVAVSKDAVIPTTYPGFFLVAYTTDGKLDQAFGSGGRVTLDFGTGTDVAEAVLYQPEGKLVVAGTAFVNNIHQFALARFEADVTTAPPSATDNQKFLSVLYNQLLGRAPDITAKTSFLQRLDPARFAALSQIAQGFVTSPEARGRFVAQAYSQILGRPAGLEEIGIWLPVIQKSGPEQVLVGVIASGEAFQRAGSTNATWLDKVYLDLLGRRRNGAETVFLDALQRGARREDVAAAVLGSNEYRSGLVRTTYLKYLNRGAESTEIASWLPRLTQPGSSERFLVAVVASGEFFLRNGNANEDWLMSLYRQVLGRELDVAGYNLQLTGVLVGYSAARNAVSTAITTSPEYRRKVIADAYVQFLQRPAAASEIDAWFSAMQHGASDETVIANILASAEYFRRAGNTTSGWLEQLLHDLVAREPERYRPLFQSVVGSSTNRLQVAANLLATRDYQQYLTGTFYLTYLGRSAGAAEADGWAGSLAHGATDEQVIAAIVASAEYFLRARRLP